MSGERGPRQRSATPPRDRTKRAEPTRYAAYTLLRAVADGAYANLELPRILRARRLGPRDAAFTTELALGTIRWQGLYDRIIEVAADRPAGRIDAKVLDVLRLGVHQLLGMRVPAHAAADQTVGLARSVAGAGAAGLVNAVMRRVSERSREEWVEAVTPASGGVEALAAAQSHPAWVVTALRAALLGHHAADKADVDAALEALLAADNDPPRVNLVARPGLASVAELVGDGDGHAEASAVSPLGVVLDSGDPGALAAVREGRAAVQDPGSQLVALALAAVPVDSSVPSRWLDLCAGPGGKSGVLAALAHRDGTQFTAIEVSEHRAELVRSTLRALPGVEVRTMDGRELGAEEPAAYGRILVDAPCTGLGALRRRPEARWRRSPADVPALAPLQRDLLHSALDAIAPGGVVGYATCSPHLAETRFVVQDVLKKRDDIEVLDARPFVREVAGPGLGELGEGPYVQLWPHLHGTDAMFLALLRKRPLRP